MPGEWFRVVNLSSYYFECDAQTQPAEQFMDLECVVTEATGAAHSLSFFYDPTSSIVLQGVIVGNDASYQIYVSTNSPVFMQQVLWALALPNNVTKTFYITGSPSAASGGYPYAVDTFRVRPLTNEPALFPAEVALPEITADIPKDLRRALERRRERQLRLHEAGLRVTPKS
jgi:hypothetical protein